MKELKELEALIVAEYSKKYGKEVNTMDPGVTGTTIGTLYGIILNSPTALKQLRAVIEKRKLLLEMAKD
jgi:hypothetical protein